MIGWAMGTHLRTELVLDALEMALSNRIVHKGQLVHHSDHGSQYLSIRYSATLAAADVTMLRASTRNATNLVALILRPPP